MNKSSEEFKDISELMATKKKSIIKLIKKIEVDDFKKSDAQWIKRAWNVIRIINTEMGNKSKLCGIYTLMIWNNYLDEKPGFLPKSLNQDRNKHGVINNRLKILREGIRCLRDVVYKKCDNDDKLRQHILKNHIFIYCSAASLFAPYKQSKLENCYVRLRTDLTETIERERKEAELKSTIARYDLAEAKQQRDIAIQERDKAVRGIHYCEKMMSYIPEDLAKKAFDEGKFEDDLRNNRDSLRDDADAYLDTTCTIL